VSFFPLEAGETLRWQGRPAPRCYTFRNWKHSLFGVFLSVPSLFWLLVGHELRANGSPFWVAWLPISFVLISAWLAAGHLFWARLEWDKLFYAVTDRRVVIQRGIFRQQQQSLALSELTGVKVRRLGVHLATLRLEGRGGHWYLCCLEHPETLLALLQGELSGVSEENI